VHKQALVKVNTLVDEGIAELISALSSFPKLRTIESCQGDSEHPAVVFFDYADEDHEHFWLELSEFVLGFLGPKLAQQLGYQARLNISVTCWGKPQGELIVRPGAMQKTLRAIKQARKEFRG
jgi:hypothetical protein